MPTNDDSELDDALALIKYSIEYKDTHGGCPPEVKAIKRTGVVEAKAAIQSYAESLASRREIEKEEIIDAKARIDEHEDMISRSWASESLRARWHEACIEYQKERIAALTQSKEDEK